MTRGSELSEMGWYAANSENRTHPVARKKANAWGLHDMHGNVWEWCADWYGAYSGGALSDPKGHPAGSERVFRGGGWFFHANRCRAASRNKSRQDYCDDNLGFRLVIRSILPAGISDGSSKREIGNYNVATSIELDCSPKTPTNNIYSAPDRISIHPDYKEGGVGTSWTLRASKKIATTSGTFLLGDLISPRGGIMTNGPYYVLESEWE